MYVYVHEIIYLDVHGTDRSIQHHNLISVWSPHIYTYTMHMTMYMTSANWGPINLDRSFDPPIIDFICYYWLLLLSYFCENFTFIGYYCVRSENINYCSNTIIAINLFGYQLYALLGFNALLLLYYIIVINLLWANYFHYCN
jgi:hypothetical protein